MIISTLAGLCLWHAAPIGAKQSVDPKAMALLRQVDARLRSLKSLSAVCTREIVHPPREGDRRPRITKEEMRVRLMKPNLARIDRSFYSLEADRTERIPLWQTEASDGRTKWMVSHKEREYRQVQVDESGRSIGLKSLVPISGFFDSSISNADRIKEFQKFDLLVSLKLIGKKTVQGVTCDLARLTYRQVGGSDFTTENIYVGTDRVIRLQEVTWSSGNRRARFEISKVKLNPPTSKSSFAFRPAAGLKPAQEGASLRADPLPLGSMAPDFTVQDKAGNPIRLSDHKGKVIIVDFWATWCGPCLDSFPIRDSIAGRYKSQGVVFLAISVGDTAKTFRSWLSKNRYPNMIFGIDPAGIHGKGIDTRLYKAGALPTVFVIGKDGRIAASFVGFGGGTDAGFEQALVKEVNK